VLHWIPVLALHQLCRAPEQRSVANPGCAPADVFRPLPKTQPATAPVRCSSWSPAQPPHCSRCLGSLLRGCGADKPSYYVWELHLFLKFFLN